MREHRQRFATRRIRLTGLAQLETAQAALHPGLVGIGVEMVLREEKRTRSEDQNAAMWAGPLRDISEQALVNGQRFSPEAWHEYLKRQFLPEDDDPELELLTKDGYYKWLIDPMGERHLSGSTTQLTVRGMAEYMRQVEAYGATEHGVIFHTRHERDH